MNPLYDFTVPVFVKMLTALDGILAKTEASLAEKNLEEAALLEDRLAPDMFPLKKQIQIACDNAKGATARLAGIEAPSHPDDEKTIAELHARIKKTIEFVMSVPEDAFKDAATRQVTLPYFPGKHLVGFDYAREHALPNFFFHVTAAYAIIRKSGVAIGKADYIGGLPLKDM